MTYIVDGATHLEKFITNLQRERSEVAFHIFTYGKQTLALNLSERFTITDEALEQMPWPRIISRPSQNNIFKSKLRFQIRHGDFRERISQVWNHALLQILDILISYFILNQTQWTKPNRDYLFIMLQDEEAITSILNWYNNADAGFLYHLSAGIKTTNSSSVWR